MAKETAEQKLLKLIEATNAQDGPAESTVVAAAPAQEAQRMFESVRGTGPGGAFVLPSLFGNLKSNFNISLPAFDVRNMTLREVNWMMAFVVVAIAINFGLGLTRHFQEAKREVAIDEQPAVTFRKESLPIFGELGQYLASISSRNIFQPYEKKVVEAAMEQQIPIEILGIKRVVEKTRELRLVGISWLDSPETASAMVENANSGVTYFLRIGDKVNEVLVKAIYADSIVVEYQSEQLELKL